MSACGGSITASGPLLPLKVIKSGEVIILKCKLIYSSFKHAIQGSYPLNIYDLSIINAINKNGNELLSKAL